MHGGQLLKFFDQANGWPWPPPRSPTCATRCARTCAVTLSVDQVVLREPIQVGELVTSDASVNRTERTSIEVGGRVTTQDLVRQTVRHIDSCFFAMVA